MSGRVLLVDDDRDMCRLLAASLATKGFDVTWRTSGPDALDALAQRDMDVVLTDFDMTGMSGVELCEQITSNRPDVPVALLTAYGSVETAISALRAGAYDFVPKPAEIETLTQVLERAIQRRALRGTLQRIPAAVEPGAFDDLLHASPSMQRVADLLQRIAGSDATVLITGESGTGKELVARALHARGPRKNGPFVAVNCAALPEALLESELFGHVRGAFTDARTSRTGLFLQAEGGTLFLDEIGELPLPLQPKLLRALQERAVRPVGGDTELPCNVRLVAATNRNLDTAVRERRFREDLYFRINVIHVELPPLRTRGDDVLLLAQHFLERHAAQTGKPVSGLSLGAAEALRSYAWPGNVRELQNCIERAVALARYDHLVVDDLPESVTQAGRSQVQPAMLDDDSAGFTSLDEVERRYLLRVLDAVRGNKTVAARTLGLDRKTLYRKLARWGVGH
jgi:two-component system response regulator HydG